MVVGAVLVVGEVVGAVLVVGEVVGAVLVGAVLVGEVLVGAVVVGVNFHSFQLKQTIYNPSYLLTQFFNLLLSTNS